MNKKKLSLGLLGAGLGLGYYINRQCFYAKEKRVNLYSKKSKSPIRITQISDFHSNVLANLGEVLRNIKDFDPHFIILTGDIIDYGTERKIERSVFFLRHLMSLGYPTYYISGNHEEACPNLDVFASKIKKLGIVYLFNDQRSFYVGENKINLYGLGHYARFYEKYKPENDAINIILSHLSKDVRTEGTSDFDFIFSGHTHGGQVRLPLIGALISPGEGFFPNYDSGEFPYKNGIIYVDSGLGNTFLPLRFLNPIGFSNITIANGSVV